MLIGWDEEEEHPLVELRRDEGGDAHVEEDAEEDRHGDVLEDWGHEDREPNQNAHPKTRQSVLCKVDHPELGTIPYGTISISTIHFISTHV